MAFNAINDRDSDRSLLLVIPPVVLKRGDDILVDGDFSNNLEAYLREFDMVTVACPPAADDRDFHRLRLATELNGSSKLRILLLPEPYREDRYVLGKGKVTRLLSTEIEKARYLLISPHAPFDWSTLAAEICIRKNRKYNMEADWNVPYTTKYIYNKLPFGFSMLRKKIWLRYYIPKYWRCLRNSALSLVKAGDVYTDYREIAPNAHPVMNIQISDEERIGRNALEAKVARILTGQPIRLVYAGRAIEMKGPMHWLRTLKRLRDRGIGFEAVWFGTGELSGQMEAYVRAHGLDQSCHLSGRATRDEVLAAMRASDVFLFCHMTRESPRCLVEALASAAPLVGFGTDYSRCLVEECGGGDFVDPGDIAGLTDLIEKYSVDREALAKLVREAAASSKLLDRDSAIGARIALMKEHL